MSQRSGRLEVSHCKKSSKKKRTPRQKSEEDEGTVLTKGPITILEPQVETRRPGPLSPKPFSPTTLHTLATRPQASDVPESGCADPSYVPSDTEHSRRKLSTTSQGRPFEPPMVGMPVLRRILKTNVYKREGSSPHTCKEAQTPRTKQDDCSRRRGQQPTVQTSQMH